jgi:hypothetical protein
MPPLAAFIASTLTAVGVPAATAITAATIIVNVATAAALSLITAELTKPPGPEAGKSTVKQAQPPRRYGIGKARVSGFFMLREAIENRLYRVISLPEGPVDHYGQAWLNDDAVTITAGVVQGLADGRYFTGKVLWDTRFGEETETNYASASAAFPSLWPSTARGDGIPSMYLLCTNGKLEDVPKDFPNGEPDPSIEAFFRAYDWRDPGQDIDDNTTWTYSANAIVNAVNVCWRRFAMDWETCFAPNLADLTVEANKCDEAVALKGGGTEPRYESGFFFDATNAFGDVLPILLSAMDGHFAQRRDGSYMIRCGHFYTPTVTLGDREVWDYEFDPGPTPDALRNCLTVSYTDPSNAYSKVQTADWADDTSVLKVGEKRDDFYPSAVQSNGQVRRLAKRQLSRLMAASGSIRCPLSARRALGERYIGLNISECDDLNGVVVELGEPTIDLTGAGSISWPFTLADPNIDAWDPATEEGDGVLSVDRPTPVPLDVPTISSIASFFGSIGSGDGTRLAINAMGPDREDLTWFYRWRVHTDTAWVEAQTTDADPLLPVLLNTGFVEANTLLDVAVAYKTGGGTLSDWSTTATVDSTVVTPGQMNFVSPANSGLLAVLLQGL